MDKVESETRGSLSARRATRILNALGAWKAKMPANRDEIENRKNIALAAIRSAFGTEEDEYGATLFVSHHLDEIEEAYWQKHLGAAQPESSRVLDILELRSHWSGEDDDGIETFDFPLPEGVTNYVIAVHFNESGQVEEIMMES